MHSPRRSGSRPSTRSGSAGSGPRSSPPTASTQPAAIHSSSTRAPPDAATSRRGTSRSTESGTRSGERCDPGPSSPTRTPSALSRSGPRTTGTRGGRPHPLKSLYVGAAGVIWALDELRSRDHAEPRTDLAAAAEETLAEWRREPDLMAEVELPSTKESGLLGRDRHPARHLRAHARRRASPTTSTSACARTSRARRRT